ncbi:cardiomyopathy-associated protein 5 [Odontesthes bonariensis]|uniref:cardiomyopathy-associated protein 5 n=1 Tax=Odontesthes bonariensis TaxID=219752 RepID=UPI003F584EEB
MEERESLDSEMTELQEFQCEASDVISQDDEDEVEELQNSLREVVQDQSVKPKLQCLMVDPSFSMVTVQSEDSGIVWETASSRCSTPWASETSSTSEASSMDGSGGAGKITIIFDEEKVVRRRTRSGGRSRLGDRLSRPGSSRSASALGVERPEMAEVSLPNVKEEKTKTEAELEELKTKDQQLFSLISEGYEILNIRVPSKLPTVDEEESTELQDNLSYLDQTPKIRSRNHNDWAREKRHNLPEEEELLDHTEPSKEDSSQPSADTQLEHTPTQKENTSDIDYFEKFTLLDVVVPEQQDSELQEEAEKPAAQPQTEEPISVKEVATDSSSVSEDTFVFVTDVEIAEEHLDEVFYGEGPPADALQQSGEDTEEAGAKMRGRRESQRSLKESGSVLFGSEETTLTPIFISPGPPKIIDLILLEEPTAMSFMYSDLYEDAVGERRRSDEECSEAESVASEKSYRRRLSDSEEADGYLEKFTLKDDTPTVDVQSELVDNEREGRMVWAQSKFEMTGCLIRVSEDEGDGEKTKTDEPKMQEVSVGEDFHSAISEEEKATGTENEEERKERQFSAEAPEDLTQEHKSMEEQMEHQQVQDEVKTDHMEPPEPGPEKPPETHQMDIKLEETHESKEHQREDEKSFAQSGIDKEKPHEAQKVAEIMSEVLIVTTDKTALTVPVSCEVPPESPEPGAQAESMERNLSGEAAADSKMVAADDKLVTEAEREASSQVEEPETATLGSEEKKATVTENEEERKERQFSAEAPEDLTQEHKSMEEQMEHQQVQDEVKTDHMEPPEPGPEKPPESHQMNIKLEETHESKEHQREDEKSFEQSSIDKEKPHEAQKVAEIMSEVLIVTTDKTALTVPVSCEVPPESPEPGAQAESMERNLSGEAAADSKMVAANEKLVTEAEREASSQVEEPETATLGSSEPLTEMKTPVEASPCEPKEAAPEDGAAVEVITDCDCDCTVQTVVEVTEKLLNEREIQTHVKIDLQEVTCVEGTDAQLAVPGREKGHEPLTEETTVELVLPKYTTEAADADRDSEVKTEILSEVSEPAMPEEVEAESESKHQQILEIEQEQQDLTDSESNQTKVVLEANSKVPAEDTGSHVQDTLTEGDELILLVPKGQAIEMDIEIGQWSEKTAKEAVAEPEPDSKCERQVPEPHTEVEPELGAKEEELPGNDLDREQSSPAPVEEAGTEAQKLVLDLNEEKAIFSLLKSFTPQEDLSCLHGDDAQSEEVDVEQKVDLGEIEDIPEENLLSLLREEAVSYVDQHGEDFGPKNEQDKEVLEAPEEPIYELGYEVISEQEAEDMPGTGKYVEESGQKKGGKMEIEVEKDQKVDIFAEEEPIEADYDIIDAEEENQARLAAELQGMDWFCATCGCLLSEEGRRSEEHHSHEVNSVDKAYEEIKETLGDWISELQARSENIEDLVSELELAYNSVEDQFEQSEAAMQAQNEEMMALVMAQYNNMSVSMEEEKKAKLEQLYDKIVSFQESIDSAKTTLETTAREAETDARPPEDIHARLRAALDSALVLELGPKGLLVFENYAKTNASSSNLTQRKGIPVPQRPTLQPQEPGSASSTSVTVYWKVNPGDVIDCFQVYCMEDPQGAVSEEYRVTVKESYCVLEELEPDKMYKVWVMAVNYTGCSLPSERLVFRTAPSVPVIDIERCTVMWDSALLKWSSANKTPEQSYTLEYCRQYELEGEGLRSISGIKACEQRVLLQPSESYLFYIKAVCEAGASEQSEAALISTKGTKFHLLKASAHPALELSEDQTFLHCSQEAQKSTPTSDNVCPSILGELLPARGLYYWETVVSGSTAYRLGAAYSTADRNSSLGENSSSWCLQCTPAASGCTYQLLHNDVQSSVCVIEMPERVGTLLDYQLGLLSFYNAQSGQMLGTFRQRFTQPCHPALALEQPGSLQLCLVQEVPEFTKDS